VVGPFVLDLRISFFVLIFGTGSDQVLACFVSLPADRFSRGDARVLIFHSVLGPGPVAGTSPRARVRKHRRRRHFSFRFSRVARRRHSLCVFIPNRAAVARVTRVARLIPRRAVFSFRSGLLTKPRRRRPGFRFAERARLCPPEAPLSVVFFLFSLVLWFFLAASCFLSDSVSSRNRGTVGRVFSRNRTALSVCSSSVPPARSRLCNFISHARVRRRRHPRSFSVFSARLLAAQRLSHACSGVPSLRARVSPPFDFST
jgi:hypothetical protein